MFINKINHIAKIMNNLDNLDSSFNLCLAISFITVRINKVKMATAFKVVLAIISFNKTIKLKMAMEE